MSIIGTIRNKFTWLLLLLVGLAMLAFLLMDGTNGRGNSLAGGNQTIGNVDGKKVKALDLQKRMQELKEMYPNADDEQLRSTAWNNILEEQIFDPRFEDLGLGVPRQELTELIKGDNPHQYTRQMFSSMFPDGNYNASQVNEFISTNENGEQIVRQLSTAITDAQRNQKYASLLRNGVNVPHWMAENEFVKENKTVTFDYVMLPYTLVSNDEVTVTDEELRDYAQKNESKYTAENGFVLQYVKFNQAPSKADTTKQMVQLQDLKERFANAENPQQFADLNTTVQINPRQAAFNPRIEYQTEKTLNFPANQTQNILNTANGEIVGPFTYNGNAYLTKVIDKKNVADSAKVRHILIQADPSNPASANQAKELADSLASELRNDKSKFEEYVEQYSSDQPSVANGGVYDFFPQGQMVPPFNDVAFNGDIGEIEVVQTQFGYHIIEPLERKGSSPGVKMATIVKGFLASEETIDASYSQAKTFERESQSEEAFIENANQYGGVKTTPVIKPNANSIQGIGESYAVMRWANNATPGSVKYFSNIGGSSIVARLDSKSKKGELDIEGNRVELTNEVRKQKKAVMLKKRIQENGGTDQDLATLANKLGRQVQTATEAKFGASGQGIGYEPEVISTLFFKNPGKVNQALEGRRGVYVVNINEFGKLPANQNYDQYKTQIARTMTGKANMNALTNQLEQKGVIKDERYKIR